MKGLRDFFYRFPVVGELFGFLWSRKRWWLIPLVFILVLFGILIIAGAATGAGPFVYTIF